MAKKSVSRKTAGTKVSVSKTIGGKGTKIDNTEARFPDALFPLRAKKGVMGATKVKGKK